MKYIIAGLLCGWSAVTVAQNPTLELETGIYSSFFNFINNRPLPASVEVARLVVDPVYDQTVASRTIVDDRRYVSSEHVKFFPKIKIKRRGYAKRNMWGFYDGQHVYVSSKNYAMTNVVRYSRILHFGRYCYFYGAEDVYKKTAGAIGGLIGTLPVGAYYLLDMQDGRFLKLTSETLGTIISTYPELYRRFEASKKTTEDLLHFIEEYNSIYTYD